MCIKKIEEYDCADCNLVEKCDTEEFRNAYCPFINKEEIKIKYDCSECPYKLKEGDSSCPGDKCYCGYVKQIADIEICLDKNIRIIDKNFSNNITDRKLYRSNLLLETIIIWKFETAPDILKELSINEGDEDWIAFIPESLKEEYIGFLESQSFGCARKQKIYINNGYILIGSHA